MIIQDLLLLDNASALHTAVRPAGTRGCDELRASTDKGAPGAGTDITGVGRRTRDWRHSARSWPPRPRQRPHSHQDSTSWGAPRRARHTAPPQA